MSAYQDRVQAVARLREIDREIEALMNEAKTLMKIVAPGRSVDRLRARWAARLLIGLTVILTFLPCGARARDHGSGAGRCRDSFTIKDRDYRTQGYIRDGKIYDRDYKIQGYVDRDKIYDRDYRPKGYLKKDGQKSGN